MRTDADLPPPDAGTADPHDGPGPAMTGASGITDVTGTKSATGIRTVTSAALMGGARELLIEHGGALYRLRVTAQGKLILTK